MTKLSSLKPERVFYYFEQICDVPHGSENMGGMRRFCRNFAVNHNLKYIADDADNVIIFKPASNGYENSKPVILQGHLDMVCQKTEDSSFDFEENGIEIFVDGDFIKAKNTTLGADNGIAVAMILAILESEDFPHPPIEAVFTSDEEIGMIGARKLAMNVLSAKRMINLDSEEDDTVTVSCAGGSDLKVYAPLNKQTKSGTKVTVNLRGLLGGHSGVEIHKGRINANKLSGDLFRYLACTDEFDIISFNGGDKSNAIPNRCKIEFLAYKPELFCKKAEESLSHIKSVYSNEPDFSYSVEIGQKGEYTVFGNETKLNIIHTVTNVPDGVIEMSREIDGLVETSTNLGVFETNEDRITLHFALRSNKNSGLSDLEERLISFFKKINWQTETFGHYPPWEYKEISSLREIYKSVYVDFYGKNPKIEAIHAGLECGVFASQIDDFDCIAIGPSLYDVHTVNEKLAISSTENTFNLLLKILAELK